jgi:hypothetical protein
MKTQHPGKDILTAEYADEDFMQFPFLCILRLKFLFPCLLLLFAIRGFSQTNNLLQADVFNFVSQSIPNRRVTLTLLDPGPQVAGPWLIAGDSVAQYTGTNGVTTFTNVLPGGYRLDIAGTPTRSFPIAMPDTNNATLLASQLVGNTNVFPYFYDAAQLQSVLASGWGFVLTNDSRSIVLTNASNVFAAAAVTTGSNAMAYPDWMFLGTNNASLLEFNQGMGYWRLQDPVGNGNNRILADASGTHISDANNAQAAYASNATWYAARHVATGVPGFTGDGSGLTGVPTNGVNGLGTMLAALYPLANPSNYVQAFPLGIGQQLASNYPPAGAIVYDGNFGGRWLFFTNSGSPQAGADGFLVIANLQTNGSGSSINLALVTTNGAGKIIVNPVAMSIAAVPFGAPATDGPLLCGPIMNGADFVVSMTGSYKFGCFGNYPVLETEATGVGTDYLFVPLWTTNGLAAGVTRWDDPAFNYNVRFDLYNGGTLMNTPVTMNSNLTFNGTAISIGNNVYINGSGGNGGTVNFLTAPTTGQFFSTAANIGTYLTGNGLGYLWNGSGGIYNINNGILEIENAGGGEGSLMAQDNMSYLVVLETSTYNLSTNDSGKLFTNLGSAAKTNIYFTPNMVVTPGVRFNFMVETNNIFQIVATNSARILNAGGGGVANGFILTTNNQTNACLTLVSGDGTNWTVWNQTGTWNVH